MATSTTRWNLVVPSDLDRSLRQFLANETENGGKKGSLSRFVAEAVNKHIFEMALNAARKHKANVPQEEIETAVEESLTWARAKRRR